MSRRLVNGCSWDAARCFLDHDFLVDCVREPRVCERRDHARASRLLARVGEGRKVFRRQRAWWLNGFPVKERSTAMGIINAGTGFAHYRPPLIAWIILHVSG